MKAVGLTRYLPIADPGSLVDLDLPTPSPQGRDLLVRIEAVSVNPIDTKVRAPKPEVEAQPKVLGFDAAGVVEAVGADVALFKPGDEVFYAGDITRQGSNAEFQLVDERIVGRKPATLDFARAAALPLTSVTAWELLFHRMRLDADGADAGRSLLIIGGAGGVGSIAIQLARRARLTTIATASRPETTAWVRRLGATHVIDHRQPLAPQLDALGFKTVDAIVNFADTDRYWKEIGELVAPQGHVGLIVEPKGPLAIGGPFKTKCVGIHWETMFGRSRFGTHDLIEQHRVLDRVAALVDAGEIVTTHTETIGRIDAANLRAAHARIES
ncbi:MAG TPA: zinc-binding alcohol dehydrogenase family protein, partial [Rhodanobacteraceae bacterium]|nr:zinc-binding alcohol dehydrogenase family protein [Rhodanobacteraceae bacterium]